MIKSFNLINNLIFDMYLFIIIKNYLIIIYF